MCKIAVKMIVTFNRKIRKKLCRFAARGDSRCLHYIPRERGTYAHQHQHTEDQSPSAARSYIGR